jgi:hypothetical protein
MALGVIVGIVVALRMTRTKPSGPEGRGDAGRSEAILVAEKELMMQQLRDLEVDRPKLESAVYQARRDALVRSAAATMRELDGLPEGDGPPPESTGADGGVPGEAMRSTGGGWTVRLAWVGATVAFFVLLGAGLTKFSAPRIGDEPMTGGDIAAESSALEEARAILESHPDDLAALNFVTEAALRRGDFEEAMSTLDRARALAPDDPEVRVHLAILQLAVGMVDRAIPELEGAVEASPGLGKAHLWLGMAQLRVGNSEAATSAFESALECSDLSSGDRAMVRMALQQATGEGAGTMPGAQGATASGSAPADSGEVRISGTIRLAQGADPVSGAVLFVVARRTAEGGGPPVAVERISPEQWPVSFELTDGSRMLGGPWPDQVWIHARLDGDGVATTRDPGDLGTQVLGPLGIPSLELELELAQE